MLFLKQVIYRVGVYVSSHSCLGLFVLNIQFYHQIVY